MSKASTKTTRLFEHVLSPGAKVNLEEGTISDVKLLGRVSKNGREYSDQALRDAARLYEGAVINIDHPDAKDGNKPRGFMEGVAVAQKTRVADDGVYGTLHTIKAHPAAAPLLEWAQRFPGQFGLSHNADGHEVSKGGKRIVESLERVISVDVVRNPATVAGLFESEQTMSTKKTTIKQIIEAEFPKTAKGAGLLEMDGMAEMPVEMPVDAGAGEDQIWAAFKQSIISVVEDDKLDTKATLKKIGEILKAYDKLNGASGEEKKDPPAGGTTESEKLLASIGSLIESKLAPVTADLDAMKRDAKIKQLCEQFQVTPDAVLLEALVKLPDEAARKSLLEREAKTRPRQNGRPKPLMESAAVGGGDDKYPEDSKGFVSSIKSR